MKPPRRLLLAVLALPVAVTLAACGAGAQNSDKGSSGSASSSSGSTGAGPRAQDYLADSDARTAGGSAPAAKPAVDTAMERSVIATGSLRLTTGHLTDSRQDAINLATGLGGHVANEQSQSDTHGRLERVDLTVRVPAASFESALDRLSRLGTVRHREQSVEDVTTQVIDTEARVKAQRASVDSIEQLLARATTIGDIMSIERQLSSRQADLDSLVQQQKYLADQTSLSTIQVTITRPATHAAAGSHHTGLFSGLEAGWHALGVTALATATALGAVLPFAVVVALVGWPVWVVVRRRRVVAPAAATEA